MNNLVTYQGNFVKYIESECNSRHFNWSDNFNLISNIHLEVSCNVAVVPSENNQVVIEMKREFIKDFNIIQENKSLIIEEKNNSLKSNFNFYEGNNIHMRSPRNMTIVNGVVYVDGQKVTSENNQEKKPIPEIKIQAPHHINLTANLDGVSILASKVILAKAKIKVFGSATVGIAAKSIKLKVSGQGNSYLVLRGGDLDINLSGQGSITTKGEYQDIDAKVSGMGSITTYGNCQNYWASVSGMGSINHNGFAKYSRKKITGMGSINGL